MFSSQIVFLRKSYGSRLNVFAPINDLSALSKSSAGPRALLAGKVNDVAISGGQILGDEYSDHVVKVRMCPYRHSTDDNALIQNRSGIILREGFVLDPVQGISISFYPSEPFSSPINGSANLDK